MPDIVENLLAAGLTEGTKQELIDDMRLGWRAELVLAQERQAKMANFLRTEGETFVEGLGQRVAVVDPTLYWEMVRRYGKTCWRDKRFRREMLRDEPGIKTAASSRKTMVRVSGLKPPEARP